MKKYFKPKNFNFQDFSLIIKNGLLYAIYIKKVPYKEGLEDSKKPNVFALARTKDGFNWEDLGNILLPNKKSWDQSMWAGTVYKEEKEFILYYTSVLFKERELTQKIGKAYSKDLINWKKDSKNPTFVFDDKNLYYSRDKLFCFRDPFPFKYKGKKYILFTGNDKSHPVGKSGCVGIVEEKSKNKFTWLPPIFSPKKYFNGLECPAIYHIRKKWYLLYGIDVENGENSVFRYAIADSPFGPYTEPKDNALLPPDQYTCRIIKFHGKLLIYYWVRDYPGGITRERLAPPKVVKVSKTGKLKLIN